MLIVMLYSEKQLDSVLGELYYDVGSPVSFGGVQRLYRVAKQKLHGLTVKQVKGWLQRQEEYGVHFPYRTRYPRSRIISAGLDYMWEMDLMDMQRLARFNSGFRYVLLVIDVFSRFVWCEPLKNKKGEVVVDVLKRIVTSSQRQPKYLRSDKGSEFTNVYVRRWSEKNRIRQILTNSEVKAAIAERAIKTVKGKIYKYLYHVQKWRYVENLGKIVDAYNNTKHSSTGIEPGKVSKENEKKLWWDMYVSLVKISPVRIGHVNVLQTGSYVRISFLRGPFDREYRQKWSSEIFQIYQRFARDGVYVYWLRDLAGEKLTGSFYREELLQVMDDPETLYKIEKVLKKKLGPDGRLRYYVKWLNWDNRFNSWVFADDVVQVR